MATQPRPLPDGMERRAGYRPRDAAFFPFNEVAFPYRINPAPTLNAANDRDLAVAGKSELVQPPGAGLHIVATPIGNLRDITLRALDTLRGVDVIACEDTRVTRKLLTAYEIRTPTLPYHDHNAAEMRPRLLARMAAGESIALVSDAGTPLISDPGYKLVSACVEAGLAVTSLPGPSAAVTALTLCALPTDRFCFAGFLPAKEAARVAVLAELRAVSASLVFYESGARLPASLAAMRTHLGAARPAAVARELTKRYEEVKRGTLSELSEIYASGAITRGEIVVVVGPPVAGDTAGMPDLDTVLIAALQELSLKEAVARASARTGISRRIVYARALALAGGKAGAGPGLELARGEIDAKV